VGWGGCSGMRALGVPTAFALLLPGEPSPQTSGEVNAGAPIPPIGQSRHRFTAPVRWLPVTASPIGPWALLRVPPAVGVRAPLGSGQGAGRGGEDSRA